MRNIRRNFDFRKCDINEKTRTQYFILCLKERDKFDKL